MPLRLSCANGHSWSGDDAAAPAVCPKCGGNWSTSGGEALSPTIVQPAALPSLAALAGQDHVPVIPEYEMLGRLGRGGMGVVYKARRHDDQRLVAIKVIRRDRLQHDEAVRRFRREAQALARLAHPNIVQVLDFDQAGDLHYLVMEFIDGITLDQLVQKQGPLPVERAVDFMRQVGLGLQQAFERGLVHRDIKPSNLMVAPTPPPEREQRGSRYAYVVKILDLSVARLLQGPGQVDSLSTLTQGGAVIGTADFVAPEQLEDPRRADIRADLYSLGCTFYFLLTGQVPFPGGTLVAKLDQQRWQTPTSVHQLRDRIPPGLVVIVERLMAKNPRDRFKTPAELVHALEQLPRTGYASPPPLAKVALAARWQGHKDAVWCLAFAGDGATLLSGSKDHTMRSWDAATGKPRRTFANSSHDVRAVAFVPGSNLAAAAVGVSLRLWDLDSGQETTKLAGHTQAVKCLLAAPDGKRLYSGGEDRTVRVWELPGGRVMQRLAKHTAEVTGLALVDGDGPLLSASRDQTVKLWDLRSGQLMRSIPAGGTAVLGMALSADASYLLTAHFDTLVRLWDVETGRELRRFLGHKQMVTAVAFLPDGVRFASASQDGTVRIWDLESGVELAQLQGAAGPLNAVAAAPDGKTLLAAGAEHDILVWRL